MAFLSGSKPFWQVPANTRLPNAWNSINTGLRDIVRDSSRLEDLVRCLWFRQEATTGQRPWFYGVSVFSSHCDWLRDNTSWCQFSGNIRAFPQTPLLSCQLDGRTLYTTFLDTRISIVRECFDPYRFKNIHNCVMYYSVGIVRKTENKPFLWFKNREDIIRRGFERLCQQGFM